MTEKEEKVVTGEETKLDSLEMTKKSEKAEVQEEQPVE